MHFVYLAALKIHQSPWKTFHRPCHVGSRRSPTCGSLHCRCAQAGPYILVGIYSTSSCWANLGRPTTQSKINLGWCKSMKNKGSMVHELGHSTWDFLKEHRQSWKKKQEKTVKHIFLVGLGLGLVQGDYTTHLCRN